MEFAARITGVGSAFPKKRLTNDDITLKLGELGIETSDQWIIERTGIRERRMSDTNNPDERNSSLGAKAAKEAMEMAKKTPEDIDQIIYATCSPDTLLPSTACHLQNKIGAKQAWAMDINAACSGFVYGLAVAEKFIFAGDTKTALVIGAELMTPLINWEDRSSCILFGDGAGAVIVEAVPKDSNRRILYSHLLSNGKYWDLIHIPAGGTNLEITPQRYKKKLHKIELSGRETFKIAVRTLTELAIKAVRENNMTIEDLDWFVPHQANIRIIKAVASRLKLPMEKVLVNIDRYGNTSTATVPTVLRGGVVDGHIKEGDTILLDVFGGGLTFGAMLLRW